MLKQRDVVLELPDVAIVKQHHCLRIQPQMDTWIAIATGCDKVASNWLRSRQHILVKVHWAFDELVG